MVEEDEDEDEGGEVYPLAFGDWPFIPHQ